MLDFKPFKFWCQKVLPAIYDDSLSYYELLCKVVAYLNDMAIQTEKQFNKLETEFNELKSFVDNYFDNLDVQDEINKKLDDMAENGTLEKIYFKFVNYVTPEMYGAIGDGVNDDTRSFERALSNNKILVLNSKSTYLLSKTIQLDNNTIIYGNNATIRTSDTFTPVLYNSLFVNKNTDMLKYNDNIKIYNINIIETINSSLTDGVIHLRGTQNSIIENVCIITQSNNSWGIIAFSANDNLTINNCNITNKSSNLGGCLWIRSGLDNGASSNIFINNLNLINNSNDESLAINSGVDTTTINVTLTNVKINSLGTNTAPLIITNKINSIINVKAQFVTITAVNSNNILIIGTMTSNLINFYGENLMLSSSKAGIISRTDNTTIFNSDINTGGLSALRCTLFACTVKDQTENCNIYNSKLNGMVINPNIVINSEINSPSNYGISILNTTKLIRILNNIIKANNRAINNASTPLIICNNNTVSRINNNNNNNTIGLSSDMNSSSCIFTNNIIYTTNNTAANSYGYMYASGLKSSNTITANVNYTVS